MVRISLGLGLVVAIKGSHMMEQKLQYRTVEEKCTHTHTHIHTHPGVLDEKNGAEKI